MNATLEQFTEAMRGAGLDPAELPTADGTFHRFQDRQDKAGKKNGWYVLHGDEPAAGMFGHWSILPEGQKWQAKPDNTLTPQERIQTRERIEQSRAARDKARDEVRAACRAKAEKMLEAAHDVSADHAYLVKKSIKPYGGRQLRDMLLIPVRKGEILTGLQIIMPDGVKKFMTGTEKAGAYLAIPGAGEIVYLVEGWATGCTIHELTGATVIVCYDCGNLEAVAREIRATGPDYGMVLVADNDRLKAGNPGLTKATAAALATGARLAIPAFPGDDGTDANDLAEIKGAAAVLDCLEAAAMVDPIPTAATAPEAIAGTGEELKPSLFENAADFLNESTNVDYLIHKLFELFSLISITGPSGQYKSFVAVCMACCVAAGRPWNGRATKQGAVLYLAGEGRSGIKRRVKAWCIANGLSPADLSGFYLSRNTLLMDGSNIGQIVTEMSGIDVALIIVDTTARHMNGHENDTKDMGHYINSVDLLKGRLKATAIMVHHTGHDQTRGRGNTAYKAALDAEVMCDRGTLIFSKMKDCEPPEPIEFKLLQVGIGTDEDGDPITSCIVKYGEKSYSNRNQKSDVKLSGAAKHIFKIITDTPDKLTTFYKDEYCKRMNGLFPDNKPDTARRNFERAVKELIEKEKVFINGEFIQSGQPDKTGQNPDTSETESGRTRTTPLKGCPAVRDVAGDNTGGEELMNNLPNFDF